MRGLNFLELVVDIFIGYDILIVQSGKLVIDIVLAPRCLPVCLFVRVAGVWRVRLLLPGLSGILAGCFLLLGQSQLDFLR